ncbi:MAG: DMT family transporter [Sulfurospirillaceae bacterium]|nr:DMT family transporter [Sulfurospirillaceae bacterium]
MKIYFLLVLCVLFWSANFVIGRFVAGSIMPFELAFFRWFGVFIVTLPFLFLHRKKIFLAIRMHFGILLILATLGIAGFNTFLYIGLQDTTATNALLINSSIPILILFLSAIILKKKITQRQTFGILLSTFGVIFLVLKGDIHTLLTLNFNQGDFWVIVSSVCWATYSVLIKFKPSSLSSFEFFIAIVALGTLILLPFYLYQGYSLSREISILAHYYWAIAYVVIFTSILSYYLWHLGITHIGADRTGQFTHLMPVFGSFLAYLFLGEVLEFYHLIGVILIGWGIYLSLFAKRVKSFGEGLPIKKP